MKIFPAAMLALALGIPATASIASAASLIGSWSGRGSVTLIPSGRVEPVSCRVSYEKGDDRGRTFVLYATCATTGGTFAQSGRVVKHSSTRYSGSMYSDQYDVSGKVNISISGTRQTVRVSSSRAKGVLKLSKR